MKRPQTYMSAPFTIRAFLFLALALALAFAPTATAARRPVVQRLAPGVYAYIGGEGSTNSGFVVTDKGVIVIDSQGPRARALDLLSRIREKTGKPVTYVINTHYHGDHTFGNQYFHGRIISHEETRRLLISEDKPHRKRFKKIFGPDSLKGFRLTLPDITFDDRLDIYEGGRILTLIHPGPAHTKGDAYVYLRKERIVFTGDILYKGRLPWLGDGSVLGNIRALDAILGLKAKIYVPGHGGVATKKDVLEYKSYLLDLVREVKRLHASGKTMKEVSRDIRLPAYSGYLKYREWLPLNAAAVYRELYGKGKKETKGGGGAGKRTAAP